MPDVLIRNVPEEVIAAIDAHAAKLGLSRNEYVRRQFSRDAHTTEEPVSVDSLRKFSSEFADIGDDDVMSQAWT